MLKINNGKRFLQSIEKYTCVCNSDDRLPNLAGYLRFMGMTDEEYAKLCEKFPKQAQLAMSVFEDEALNSGTKKISASVLNLYLKSRFGYGGEEKGDGDGILSVVCEHGDGE